MNPKRLRTISTRKTWTGILCAALVVVAGPAAARVLAGVKLPDRVDVAGKSLILNGMGIREATFLNVKVYVAGLYLETRMGDAKRVLDSVAAKRLVLYFVREVTRDQVVDAWNEGFEKNAGKNLAALQARIRRLDAWMVGFRAHDTLSFTYVPGAGVTVAVNATTKGTIEGDDFARGLFAIWLGPEPPNASLKAGLLGKM